MQTDSHGCDCPLSLHIYQLSTADRTPFQTQVRCLTRFAQQTRTGFYGQQRQVQSSTVSQAILAVGQTIALACNHNLTKVTGSKHFFPALQVMLDRYSKLDLPTKKNAANRGRCSQPAFGNGMWERGHSTRQGHRRSVHDHVLLPFMHWGIYCQRETKQQQNKRSSSSSRMSNFLRKTKLAPSCASHELTLRSYS